MFTLGESERREVQGYPGTARTDAPLTRYAGRSVAYGRLVARGHGDYSGRRDWVTAQSPNSGRRAQGTWMPPADPPGHYAGALRVRLYARLCVIGKVAPAPLTGDSTGSKPAHP